jgi:DNA-binding beta-propeller fold protein YncE
MSFSLAYYAGDRRTGSISVIQEAAGKFTVKSLPVAPAGGADAARKPILIGVAEDHRIVLLDPASKEIQLKHALPADAFPAHLYSDPRSSRDWFMNDGDKETGNDTLNCGDRGSSVTVVDRSGSVHAEWLKTICVGRGHHQAAFTCPAPGVPQVPARAYISNLQDGTLSVIGNDPDAAATYLQVLDTVNLCEPEKEEGGETPTVPNRAFPHGLAYSSHTGKLYNLNNGYGTIALIDPLSGAIEERIPFKGHSNLFASPDGRYLIGRGADRKSNPDHVIATLSVFDVAARSVVAKLDLPDIYIGKYYYNPEGSKLYLTTASSGSPQQQCNLKTDVLLIFDMAALPRLELIKELKIGASAALAFEAVNGRTRRVFSSNSAAGSVLVLDGENDALLETIAVGTGQPHSRIWMLNQ